MRYLIHTPHPLLKPYIERIYILEHDGYLATHAELSSVANCCSAMVLNYGDRYRLHSDLAAGTLLPVSFLTGFSSQAYRLELTGQVSMLGIIFKGTGLRAFFSSIALGELVNQRHDLNAVIGPDADRLLEQLAESPTHAARFALIETYLLQRFRLLGRTPTVADQAAHIMLHHRGMLTMDWLANTLNVCPRHLRRVFNEQAGISPKFFARLKRFNYVHYALHQNPNIGWPDFLTNGGYYDQSHLIKDFVEFTGKAPSVALHRYQKLAELVAD